MKIKGREESILRAEADFRSTNNEKSILSQIDPKLIEAYLAKEIARTKSENDRPPIHQVTIFTDRNTAGNFKTFTVPLVGDEIMVHNRNGREQVYKVIKIRHSAYFSTEKLESSSVSNAIVWCELIQNPEKVGLVFAN